MSIVEKSVKIKGMSPLLMHRFPLDPVEAIEKKTIEVQAEISAYRDEDKNLFIPGINIQRAIVAGAAYSKGKGRSTLAKPVAACVQVTPEHVLLGTKEYIIDRRAVVVPATKGRIVRCRPRLDTWEVEFTIEFDDVLLTEVQMKRILDDTGTRVGLLDFRPERKGPFGRFMVTSWE